MSYASQKLAEEKVFKDPVHRYIHVRDQVIWDVIGAKEFQRLRRIRQLGTTYLVFHGAEHSRFNHSLGVYEAIQNRMNYLKAVLCIWQLLMKKGTWSHTYKAIIWGLAQVL